MVIKRDLFQEGKRVPSGGVFWTHFGYNRSLFDLVAFSGAASFQERYNCSESRYPLNIFKFSPVSSREKLIERCA